MANEILSPRQIAILTKISQEDYFKQNFYLTGGTASASAHSLNTADWLNDYLVQTINFSEALTN